MYKRKQQTRRGFSLIELLTVIGIIAILTSILTPCLAMAKKQAEALICLSNTRQLGFALIAYSMDYNGYAMPNYDPATDTYWWGHPESTGIDHTAGYVWPYLQSQLKEKGVFECPSQKYGSYRLQGKPLSEPEDPKWITSTYGYNGYYLCPPRSPWTNIRYRPWKKLVEVKGPSQVIAFGDSMLDWDTSLSTSDLSNTAMIDPPYILDSSRTSWVKNSSPTTCFRHNKKANLLFVDGHCDTMDIDGGEYTSPDVYIGSVKGINAPHYVPDSDDWISGGSGRRRR